MQPVAGGLDGDRQAVLARGDHGRLDVGGAVRRRDDRRARVERGVEWSAQRVVGGVARQVDGAVEGASQPAECRGVGHCGLRPGLARKVIAPYRRTESGPPA
jgi:hypothetical protein